MALRISMAALCKCSPPDAHEGSPSWYLSAPASSLELLRCSTASWWKYVWWRERKFYWNRYLLSESIPWPLTSLCTWYLPDSKAHPCVSKPTCNQWISSLVATAPIVMSHSCGEIASPRTLLGPIFLYPGSPLPLHRCRGLHSLSLGHMTLSLQNHIIPVAGYSFWACAVQLQYRPRSYLLLLDLLASFIHSSSLHMWRYLWRVFHLNIKYSRCTYKW